MTYYFNQYYKCGDKKFHNISQAFDQQRISGNVPEYVIDHELIDSIENFKKPKDISSKRIRELMITRLRALRKKYNRLVLAYSGGTDSYTILRLCVDNDIYIDETFTHMVSTRNDLRTNIEYIAALKCAKPYEGKMIGKCTIVHPTVDEHSYVDNPFWFRDDMMCPGANITWRPYGLPALAKKVTNHDPSTLLIVGYEKPKITLEDGKLFWTMTDAGIGEMMGIPNAVPFYSDKENPELTVSLAYATLDNINVKDKGKNGFISYTNSDAHTKKKLLTAYGYHTTGHYFLDMALLGKESYHQNKKTLRLFKELDKIGLGDYRQKIIDTHARIKKLYGDLPYALEYRGNLIKPIGRFSQKVSILQDKFGG